MGRSTILTESYMHGCAIRSGFQHEDSDAYHSANVAYSIRKKELDETIADLERQVREGSDEERLKQFIEMALNEDIGSGDHTSLASTLDGAKPIAELMMKTLIR